MIFQYLIRELDSFWQQMLWEQVDDWRKEPNFIKSDYKLAMKPNYQVSAHQLVHPVNKTDKFLMIKLFADYISEFI